MASRAEAERWVVVVVSCEGPLGMREEVGGWAVVVRRGGGEVER